ncbi:putative baseplate assembly protein [Methylotuvimicrobium sp.]|uniref:putative baseplate assembly protein n=1 Tax=Methylotuvimicrobium sp. TaxID=2822413 RepID=UPI003D657BCF
MKTVICKDVRRREGVRRHVELNGLDYLEVAPNQLGLSVFFLGKAPVQLDKSNIVIEGGQRIRDIRVERFDVIRNQRPEFDDRMDITVNQAGDFSSYTLRVVERDEQGQWRRHRHFDPLYDRIEFSFKIDCPNDSDCRQQALCPPDNSDAPDIDYLAKDYASFRKLILDRLAITMPDWRERHVPDIGVALVEVLAYAGDHLSYYQDAVATEAYLETARRRISVRRHARLVDYAMHEGCNARSWICAYVDQDISAIDPKDIYFITGFDDSLRTIGIAASHDDLLQFPSSLYEVYEPVAEGVIDLYTDHNRIEFHTWNDRQCCIPKGATHATLKGQWIPPVSDEDPHCGPERQPNPSVNAAVAEDSAAPKLRLKPGDIVVFEEIKGPKTGHAEDADPKQRHAVRLVEVAGDTDPLNGQAIVHIAWNEKDALPFPLCLSALGQPPDCTLIENISIACGNVVLVDHGKTVTEALDPVPDVRSSECCKAEGMPADQALEAGHFNPALQWAPITFSEPPAFDKPAVNRLEQDACKALPVISLIEGEESDEDRQWRSCADLLSSHADDRHFVAEIDERGRAVLRFGDGEMGKSPEAGTKFFARYRTGNGTAGNAGAESIKHVIFKNNRVDGIREIRNPLPALGGTDAEPVAEVKLFAPGAFRNELQRAVIAEDYAAIVLREFKTEVQHAVATLRWNGSWHEVWLAIDPFGREEAEPSLLAEITACLHRYRRMGHDLIVKSAHRVPLDVAMLVCVLPSFVKAQVKAELLKTFSNRTLPGGGMGFFHPDNLTFGEDVYLSKIVAEAQTVHGVESVTITRLQRFGQPANDEIENGVLPLGLLEIARMDNDPNFPENGKLTLELRGGR